MTQMFFAKRPITAKCKKPRGATIQISVGDRVIQRADGWFTVNHMTVECLSPPTVRIDEFVFDLSPFISASDLEAVQ
ncbi:hypothetical protein [uncultured Roseobacter sp.]|uniref:hypothetical protein n=1 Tax=uncultured Roseobacter sp. TaxID=114847 RepID=UPI0026238A34|nr:hypothetical protein [uncultured Roseobacter sp.]